MLSKVLSEAIRQALHDLELVRNDSRYIVNFCDWHLPEQISDQFITTKCSVCFAGAVMAKTLGGDIDKYFDPLDFEEEEHMLRALNCVRGGDIEGALAHLDLDLSEGLPHTMPVNQNDYTQFVKDVTAIADTLQSYGL